MGEGGQLYCMYPARESEKNVRTSVCLPACLPNKCGSRETRNSGKIPETHRWNGNE